MLPHLVPRIPRPFGTYFEPFVGGGALYFQVAPAKAVLSDTNERLIRTYRGIQTNVDEVIGLLEQYPHDEAFYYRLRDLEIDNCTDAEVAAWFVYLNKTGFNGLYRVNRSNRFNVPFGRYAKPNFCDREALRACSRVLSGAELRVADFEAAVCTAKSDDFVYFDPPYIPLSATSSFASYTSGGFDVSDQKRLSSVALGLKRRGVHVLLSNSSAPLARSLYGEGFLAAEVAANRLLNSRTDRRGAISELIFQ